MMCSCNNGGFGNSGAHEMMQETPSCSIVCGVTNVADVKIKLSVIVDIGVDILGLISWKFDLQKN